MINSATFRARCRINSVLYWALFAIVVLTAAGALLIGLGARDCAGDEYNSIFFVNLGFWEFLKQFPYGLLLKVQFWICDRLFAGALAGYRVPGALAGIFNAVLLMLIARRLWPRRKALPFLAGAFLAFNTTVWLYCQWGMAVYGESILMGGVMLWLFFYLIERPLPWRSFVPVLIFFILSPYLNFTALIGYFAGVAALIFVSRRENRPVGWIGPVAAAWEFKYFLIVPLIFLFARLMDPNWDFYANRPGLHPPFYELKEYTHDLAGLFAFLADRYHQLISDMVDMAYPPLPFHGRAAYLVNLILRNLYLWAIPVGVLLPFENGRWSRRRLFLSCYFLICLACVGVLGAVGRFPFGPPRYTLFLVDVAVLLMALGVVDTARYVFVIPGRWLLARIPARPGWLETGRWVAVAALAAIVFLAGWGMIGSFAWIHEARSQQRRSFDRLFGIITSDRSDMVLMDESSSSWMNHIAKNLTFNAAERMNHGRNAPSAKFVAAMTDAKNPVNSVMIVIYGPRPWDKMSPAETAEFGKYLPAGMFKPVLSHSIEMNHVTRLERIKPIPTANTPAAPKILAWGPQSMPADKLGSMWVKAENITPRTVIMREGYELRSLPTSGVITAFTGEDCFPAAGKYELYLLDRRTGLRSQSVYMTIVPKSK